MPLLFYIGTMTWETADALRSNNSMGIFFTFYSFLVHSQMFTQGFQLLINCKQWL